MIFLESLRCQIEKLNRKCNLFCLSCSFQFNRGQPWRTWLTIVNLSTTTRFKYGWIWFDWNQNFKIVHVLEVKFHFQEKYLKIMHFYRNVWVWPSEKFAGESILCWIWAFNKGSSHQSHFIIEMNVGKRRIRYRATLKLNF